VDSPTLPQPLAAWLESELARLWPGAQAASIAALKGDASERRFWRVRIGSGGAAPATAILVDLGPDDLPVYVRALDLAPKQLNEPPWISVRRLFAAIGVDVPALYGAEVARRAMLVEDVGDLTLFDAARASAHAAADLYRLAVEQLLVIHAEGTRRADPRCIAARIHYDRRLFRWELLDFEHVGLPAIAPGADARALQSDLDALAAALGSFPRVLSHRDYHGRNLFVQQGPRLRVIDFQDALMAPPAQDLAVLLTTRDAADVIAPVLEQRLLNFYQAGAARRGAAIRDADAFVRSYRLCVLQHALKMIGRFIKFGREGKSGYDAYVPRALEQARRMLALLGGEFPRLRPALPR
jgi:N-acetylmuramate 1-kinase